MEGGQNDSIRLRFGSQVGENDFMILIILFLHIERLSLAVFVALHAIFILMALGLYGSLPEMWGSHFSVVRNQIRVTLHTADAFFFQRGMS